MRSSIAYFFKDNIYIHSSSKSTAGVWLFSEPVYVIAKSDIEILGVKTLESLSFSKMDIEHPTSFKGMTDPLLKKANVKSYNTFAKNALCVSIELENNIIKIIPTINLGPKGGYADIEEKVEILKNPDPKEFGEMILKVFSYCR